MFFKCILMIRGFSSCSMTEHRSSKGLEVQKKDPLLSLCVCFSGGRRRQEEEGGVDIQRHNGMIFLCFFTGCCLHKQTCALHTHKRRQNNGSTHAAFIGFMTAENTNKNPITCWIGSMKCRIWEKKWRNPGFPRCLHTSSSSIFISAPFLILPVFYSNSKVFPYDFSVAQ